ncbi:hypothetical protein ABE61_03325 [Lysinibacillus sphaericus]|uniref:hypothetical protein n=1 Tax=Lysinibacillus sphaericus TaxID=1421 RepID=UPI0018CEB49A|nr:hypothetical protein [Lysinibacillus sphaericus]MBG9453118.1 hypothetical protein [Lysinibacillus sphaericus]MBG9477589.1 hypothetical protein [Lysinibacillus sphaericus]MBG9594384.1 hypothetical protein [Lysinibacillus sphaericus]
MKKEIGILMLLSIFTLSGCSLDKSTTSTVKASGEQETTQSEQQNNAKLIEASDDKKVKLYALNEENNEIKSVVLDIDGEQKNFDWEIPNTGTKPQLFYTDLTNDNKEEAVVIIQTGRGTGLDNYDIHVINVEDFLEIKVQSYEDIVANEIKSKVVKNDDGTLTITATAQGKESRFDYDFDPAPNLNQDELAFGGVVIYTLENQKIKLNMPGSVGVSPVYVGDFNITYKFDSAKNEFIVDQIEMMPTK